MRSSKLPAPPQDQAQPSAPGIAGPEVPGALGYSPRVLRMAMQAGERNARESDLDRRTALLILSPDGTALTKRPAALLPSIVRLEVLLEAVGGLVGGD